VEGVISVRPAAAFVIVRRRNRDGHIAQMHMQLSRMRVERKSADMPQDREGRHDPETEPSHRRVLAMHIASPTNAILEGWCLSNTTPSRPDPRRPRAVAVYEPGMPSAGTTGSFGTRANASLSGAHY
jgi:hypothetical protein